MLEAVAGTNIGIMTFSDHAPVTLQLKSGVAQVRSNTWRLNKDLLQDKAIEERIHEELVQFFRINNTEGISEATVWEAHNQGDPDYGRLREKEENEAE